MKNVSRIFLFGVLMFLLLAACTGQQGTPTAIGTAAPGNETAYPGPGTETTEIAATDVTETAATLDTTATVDLTGTPLATDTTQTPGVPVIGSIRLECQFCIEGVAHALLVLPETTTFEVLADSASLSTPGPDMGCNTVDSFNGRQIVICRGEENTSFNVNICTDGTNCTQLLVELQTCPLGTPQPGATETPGGPTNTPTTGGPTNTPTLGVITATPFATDTPGAATATPTP